jgi:hypothetical protein
MRRAASAITLLLASCGTLGPDTGGSENLPNRGVLPYERIGPLFPGARAPSAIVAGSIVSLYFEFEGAVWRADGDGATFGDPVLVLEDATSPSVAYASDGKIHIAYVDTSSAVIVAALDEPRVELARVEGGGDPSLTKDALYYTSGDQILRDGEPVFDRGKTPEVRVATTALGRTVYRMMYGRTNEDGVEEIAFAASFDGRMWSDFSQNPVLPGEDPSNLLFEDRYFLYYVETGTIAVAINAPAAPSESF